MKLLLPPNFPAAAERNAIPVRLQLDLTMAPDPALLPALALLQRLCGGGPPPPFIQLSRKQLRELLELTVGQPILAYVRSPEIALEWVDGSIPAITPYLAEKESPPEVSFKLSSSTSPLKRPGLVIRSSTERDAASASIARTSGGLLEGTEHYLALTMPSRERPSYSFLLDLAKSNGFVLEPSNRKYWLRERHKVLSFLAQHQTRLVQECRIELAPAFVKSTAHLSQAEFVCAAVEAGDSYSLTLAIRAGTVPEGELRAALATNRGYVEESGRIYLLDTKKMERMMEAQRALAGDPTAGLSPVRSVRIRASQVAEASSILEELSPNFEPPSSWLRRSESLRNLSRIAPAPTPACWASVFRPYQRLGVAWLWYLQSQGLGAILADEMGLGKTLQALGLIHSLCDSSRGPCKPCLVVAPASLLENWRREALRFAPDLRVFVHHSAQRLNGPKDFGSHDLVVTSYGTLTRDREVFGEVDFECVVADEAQHIKNRRSQNAQSLRSLNARSRFLLTGTPLENSLDDLRSLFEFLMPGFLPQLPPGLKREEKLWHDKRILSRTAPYILRRTKVSVAPELPPKIEQVLWCEMSEKQAALYRSTQEHSERELIDLESGGASEARLRFAMLTQLLRLRQICCDPRLAKKSAQTVNPETAESAKLEALIELLEEAIDDGHRVLIFSQFTSMLDLLVGELSERAISFCRLDGSMTARARQAEVDRFQREASVPVFLLSLKAGGTGLNLTGADTVVHFDPWWNPAAEMQATDRAHRIGQTRTVSSYKLICSGTVEEKVLALQEEKRALLAEVFEASDEAANRLSLTDLRSLLTK